MQGTTLRSLRPQDVPWMVVKVPCGVPGPSRGGASCPGVAWPVLNAWVSIQMPTSQKDVPGHSL